MKYRVALAGFTSFERHALVFCLHESGAREPTYEFVDTLADADLVIADGEMEGVVDSVLNHGRMQTTAFVGLSAPHGAIAHVVRPIDPERILSSLDELLARRRIALPPARDPTADGSPLAGDARSIAKAAARQAARRARLAAGAELTNATPVSSDILVLDPSDAARDHLCGLLEDFGFCTYPARGVAQAAWLAQTRSFTAAFLDIDFNDLGAGDAIELCRRIKDATTAPATGPACALLTVSSNARPSERVRAALAGSDAFMTKPLSRGDVARALEACCIVLPADARRH